MNVNIEKTDFEVIEREYENTFLSSMQDDEDIFVPIPDIGICRIRKGKCRSLIDQAKRQFNSGKRYVKIQIDPY